MAKLKSKYNVNSNEIKQIKDKFCMAKTLPYVTQEDVQMLQNAGLKSYQSPTQIHSHHILQIPVPKNTNASFVKVSHHFQFCFAQSKHFRCEILSPRAIFNSYFQ